MIGAIDEKPVDFLDEMDLDEIKQDITEYEDRMDSVAFAIEDAELRDYLEDIDLE